MKQIFKHFADYMIDRQITREVLFEEIDRNRDGRINAQELTRFTTENTLIEGVGAKEVEILFSFLDSN